MVLENFLADADILWDRAGKKLFEKPEARTGRIMRVQVTNRGVVEDLTGYTLNLGWKSTIDETKFGLDAFEAADITKGIFELEYTSVMLTNIGTLKAALQLVPTVGNTVESNNFLITVTSSAVDAEAVQSESSFSTLTTALVQVNGWNATIGGKISDWESDMTATKQLYIDNMEEVEATYPQELLSITSQLAENVQQKNRYKDDPNNKPYRGISFHFINGYTTGELTRFKGLVKTFYDMGFNSIGLYIDGFVSDAEIDIRIPYVNELMTEIRKYDFQHVMFRCAGNFGSYVTKADYFTDMSRCILRYLAGTSSHTFNSVAIGTEDITATSAYATEWLAVINNVRAVYSGLIVSVSYVNQLETLTFAEHVDHLGFDVYPALTYNPEITQISNQELIEKFWVRGGLERIYNYCVKHNKKAFIIESGNTPFKLSYTGPGTWQTGLEFGVDGDSQMQYWRTALSIFDNSYWLKGYMMFDGTSGYSPISADSSPELKQYIEDLFLRGVENGKI